MNCIIIPAEHLDLIDIQTTPVTRVGPILIQGGVHEGKYAVASTIVDVPEMAALVEVLNQEPVLSAKIVADIDDEFLLMNGTDMP